MQDNGLLTAIDVGTTKVFTILGKRTGPGRFDILAHSLVPSHGLKKGNVADVAATQEAVRRSIDDVERKSGMKVESAYVGVTGSHIEFENRWQPMGWAGKRGIVTSDDLARVSDHVASSGVGDRRRLIHALPKEYAVDGQGGIRNPEGMHSKQVEVETHVVTGDSSVIRLLVSSVEQAGIKVDDLVLQPLASGEAALTPSEREDGAAIVDIGGGTTDIVVFRRGAIAYTAAIPVGGYQFTNDICLTYNSPYPAAEEAKLTYAHTEPYMVKTDEDVPLPVVDQTAPLRIPRRDLVQLMRERAHELARLVMLRLREAGVDDIANFTVVLSGGTSNLPGLEQLMRRTLGMRVRLGSPDQRPGLPAELQSPAHSTGVGIMIWASKQQEAAQTEESKSKERSVEFRGNNVVSRFFRQVRALLAA